MNALGLTRISPGARIRAEDGTLISLDVSGWTAPANEVERRRLLAVAGPVLDIGCGPGRLVMALAERGVPALGVDASPVAVEQARRRGAPALVRSVYDPLPGTGRWQAALLFDGNVGIGGDPARLLARTAELLAPGGAVLVEVAPPATGLHCFPAQVERNGVTSGWFPWAVVGPQELAGLAAGAGLSHRATTEDEGRWFVELVRGRPDHEEARR